MITSLAKVGSPGSCPPLRCGGLVYGRSTNTGRRRCSTIDHSVRRSRQERLSLSVTRDAETSEILACLSLGGSFATPYLILKYTRRMVAERTVNLCEEQRVTARGNPLYTIDHCLSDDEARRTTAQPGWPGGCRQSSPSPTGLSGCAYTSRELRVTLYITLHTYYESRGKLTSPGPTGPKERAVCTESRVKERTIRV
jgi:hypothetical protein